MLTHERIIELTNEYGGEWGVMHGERLLKLISMLDEGIEYDREAVWLAAYLHDWGGYGPWAKPGVEHFDRSAEVAEEFLRENGYPEDFSKLVLECIKYHHGGPEGRSIESVLLTDADAVDIVGALGTLKVFSICGRDMKLARAAAQKYRDGSVKAVTTEKAREMVRERIKETDEMLRAFDEESFGLY